MHRRLFLPAAVLLVGTGLPAFLMLVARLALEPVPPAPARSQDVSSGAPEGRVLTSVDGPSPPLGLPTRMRIERIGVDAPLSVKSRTRTGLMESPDGPEDIAWYDFSARPGSAGNGVFSGHVNYHDYGPAVFARLHELRSGDPIEVLSADGAAHRYAVGDSTSYRVNDAPVEAIVGPTGRASITLITCTGGFDGASRSYSHRLVVRAEAV